MTSVLTVHVRTVERVSIHLADIDVNVAMDTAGKTAIWVSRNDRNKDQLTAIMKEDSDLCES